MKYDLKFYKDQLKNLEFNNIDQETWETIQDEGIPEEFDLAYMTNYKMASLKLLPEDVLGLMSLSEETLEKFNEFDIYLKDTYDLKYIDLIDYTTGKIRIIRVF